MNKSLYTNIAFISYKREDEAWAKWLQRKLEHYKLPTEIRKKNPNLEFSEHPRHVFKDTTDLNGGVLAKEIKKRIRLIQISYCNLFTSCCKKRMGM